MPAIGGGTDHDFIQPSDFHGSSRRLPAASGCPASPPRPLDPVKQEDFLSQLAQFSTLEGIEKLNVNFSVFLQLQTLTGGARPPGTGPCSTPAEGQELTGVVEAVAAENGELLVVTADRTVPVSQVSRIIA